METREYSIEEKLEKIRENLEELKEEVRMVRELFDHFSCQTLKDMAELKRVLCKTEKTWEEVLLEALKEKGFLTTGEVVSLLGCSLPTALSRMRKMAHKPGIWLERKKGRGGGFVLVRKE